MAIYDAGDLCVVCGNDTSFGSGRFIDRVASNVYAEDSELRDDALAAGCDMVGGFVCAGCLELECDRCGEPIAPDEDYLADGAVYHYLCISREDYIQHLLEEGYTADDPEFAILLSDYDHDHSDRVRALSWPTSHAVQ